MRLTLCSFMLDQKYYQQAKDDACCFHFPKNRCKITLIFNSDKENPNFFEEKALFSPFWAVFLFPWAMFLFQWATNLFPWAVILIQWATDLFQGAVSLFHCNKKGIASEK
ncbi:MAG: hypothetical protein IK011_02105 [Bacteroidaceae bacterium]|nr:hypothetical protein [Bacteroidaceae bacterium]MBR4778664.1 hypothetical protein [Bacteroidaceae bacterium]